MEFVGTLKRALSDPDLVAFSDRFLEGKALNDDLTKRLSSIGDGMHKILMAAHKEGICTPLLKKFLTKIKTLDTRQGILDQLRIFRTSYLKKQFDMHQIPQGMRRELLQNFQAEIYKMANSRFKELGVSLILPGINDPDKFLKFAKELIESLEDKDEIVKMASLAKFHLRETLGLGAGSRAHAKRVDAICFYQVLKIEQQKGSDQKIEDFFKELKRGSDYILLLAKLMNCCRTFTNQS